MKFMVSTNSFSFLNSTPNKAEGKIYNSTYSPLNSEAQAKTKHNPGIDKDKHNLDVKEAIYNTMFKAAKFGDMSKSFPSSLAYLKHCEKYDCVSEEDEKSISFQRSNNIVSQNKPHSLEDVAENPLVYNKRNYLSVSHESDRALRVVEAEASNVKVRNSFQKKPTKANSFKTSTPFIIENASPMGNRDQKRLWGRLKYKREKSSHCVPISSRDWHTTSKSELQKDITKQKFKEIARRGNMIHSSTHASANLLQSENNTPTISARNKTKKKCLDSCLDFSQNSFQFRDDINGGSSTNGSDFLLRHYSTPKESICSEKASEYGKTKEQVLRSLFLSICTCYWSRFPELGMPINPASHAPTCQCYNRQSAYEAIAPLSEESSEDNFTEGVTSSRSSSSNIEDNIMRTPRTKLDETTTDGKSHEAGACLKQKVQPTKENALKSSVAPTCKKNVTSTISSSTGHKFSKEAIKVINSNRNSRDYVINSHRRMSSSCLSPPKIRRTSSQSIAISNKTKLKEGTPTHKNVNTVKIKAASSSVALEDYNGNSIRQTNAKDVAPATGMQCKKMDTSTHQSSRTYVTCSEKCSCIKFIHTSNATKKNVRQEPINQSSSSRLNDATEYECNPSPGPGTYDVPSAHTYSSQKHKPPQVIIGRATRQTLERVIRKTETPGPGTYDITHSTTTAAVCEKGKCDAKMIFACKPISCKPFLSDISKPLRYQARSCPLSEDRSSGYLTPHPAKYWVEGGKDLDVDHIRSDLYSFRKPACTSPLTTSSLVDVPVTKSKKRIRAIVIKSPEINSVETKNDYAPGPGVYQPRTGDEIGSCGRCAIFGSSTARGTGVFTDTTVLSINRRKDGEKSDSPGPGSYAIGAADPHVQPQAPPSHSFWESSKATDLASWDGIKSLSANGHTAYLRQFDRDRSSFARSTTFQKSDVHRTNSQYKNSMQCAIGLQNFHCYYRQHEESLWANFERKNSFRGAFRDSKSCHGFHCSLTAGRGEYMPLYTTQKRGLYSHSFRVTPRFFSLDIDLSNTSDSSYLTKCRRGKDRINTLGRTSKYTLDLLLGHARVFTSIVPKFNNSDQFVGRSVSVPGSGTYDIDSAVMLARCKSIIIGSRAPKALFDSALVKARPPNEHLPGACFYGSQTLTEAGFTTCFVCSRCCLPPMIGRGSRTFFFEFPGPDMHYAPPLSHGTILFRDRPLSTTACLCNDLTNKKYGDSFQISARYDVGYDHASGSRNAVFVGKHSLPHTTWKENQLGQSKDRRTVPNPGNYGGVYNPLEASTRSGVLRVTSSGALSEAQIEDTNHKSNDQRNGGGGGPRVHDLTMAFQIPKYPEFFFFKTPRDLDQPERSPGHRNSDSRAGQGTYSAMFTDVQSHQQAVMGHAPSRKTVEGMGQGEKSQCPSTIPGVGTYEVCLTRDGHPFIHHPPKVGILRPISGTSNFDTAPRLNENVSGVPGANCVKNAGGPAAYSVTKDRTESASSTTADSKTGLRESRDKTQKSIKKDCLNDDKAILRSETLTQAPGPGYYEPNFAHVKPRVSGVGLGVASVHERSCRGRNRVKSKNDVLRPREYDADTIVQQSQICGDSFYDALRFPEITEGVEKWHDTSAHPSTLGWASCHLSSTQSLHPTAVAAATLSFPCPTTAGDRTFRSELRLIEEWCVGETSARSQKLARGLDTYQTVAKVCRTRTSSPGGGLAKKDRFASPFRAAELDPMLLHENNRKDNNDPKQSVGPDSHLIPLTFPTRSQHCIVAATDHPTIIVPMSLKDQMKDKEVNIRPELAYFSHKSPELQSDDSARGHQGSSVAFASNNSQQGLLDRRKHIAPFPRPRNYNKFATRQVNLGPMKAKCSHFNSDSSVPDEEGYENVGDTSLALGPRGETCSLQAISIEEVDADLSSIFVKTDPAIEIAANQGGVSRLADKPSPHSRHDKMQGHSYIAACAKRRITINYSSARYGKRSRSERNIFSAGPGFYSYHQMRKTKQLLSKVVKSSFITKEHLRSNIEDKSVEREAESRNSSYLISPMFRRATRSLDGGPLFDESSSSRVSSQRRNYADTRLVKDLPSPRSYNVQTMRKTMTTRSPALVRISHPGGGADFMSYSHTFIDRNTSEAGRGDYDMLTYHSIDHSGGHAVTLSKRTEVNISTHAPPACFDTRKWKADSDKSFVCSTPFNQASLESGLTENTAGFDINDDGSNSLCLDDGKRLFSILGCSKFRRAQTAVTGASRKRRDGYNDRKGIGYDFRSTHESLYKRGYSFSELDSSFLNDRTINQNENVRSTHLVARSGTHYSSRTQRHCPKEGCSLSLPRESSVNSKERRVAAITPSSSGNYYLQPVATHDSIPTYSVCESSYMHSDKSSVVKFEGPHMWTRDCNTIVKGGSDKNDLLVTESDSQQVQDRIFLSGPRYIKYAQGVKATARAKRKKNKKSEEKDDAEADNTNVHSGKPTRCVHFADEGHKQTTKKMISFPTFESISTLPSEREDVSMYEVYLEKLTKVGYPVKRKLCKRHTDGLML